MPKHVSDDVIPNLARGPVGGHHVGVEPRRLLRRPTHMHALKPTPATQALAAAILTAALASGCGVFNDEAAATWDLAPDQTLDVDTTTFTALVTRLGCNSGVTGDVNEPDIEAADGEVVITFTVSPGEPSSATCQGNNQVAYEVQLPEALADRKLVDGECASTKANSTEPCQPNGVRYTP